MNKFNLNWKKTSLWSAALAGAFCVAGGVTYQSMPLTADAQCNSCGIPAYNNVVYSASCVPQPVTRYRVVYETVYDEREEVRLEPAWTVEMRTKTVTTPRQIQETALKDEQYTVKVPVKEVQYQKSYCNKTTYVPETVERTIVETVQKPVQKIVMKMVTRTVKKPVTQMQMVNRLVNKPEETIVYKQKCIDLGEYRDEMVLTPRSGLFDNRLTWETGKVVTDPVTGQASYQRAGLYWTKRDAPEKGRYEIKKTWVPNIVSVQTPQTQVVMRQVCEQIPVPYTFYEDEIVQEMVPVTVTEMQTEQVVRKVPQTVMKPVTERVEKVVPIEVIRWRDEVRTRQVEHKTFRIVNEQRTEQVPVRVCKTKQVTVKVRTPRVVCKTVPYTCYVNQPVAVACPTRCAPVDSCPSSCTLGAPEPAVLSSDSSALGMGDVVASGNGESSILEDSSVTPATYVDAPDYNQDSGTPSSATGLPADSANNASNGPTTQNQDEYVNVYTSPGGAQDQNQTPNPYGSGLSSVPSGTETPTLAPVPVQVQPAPSIDNSGSDSGVQPLGSGSPETPAVQPSTHTGAASSATPDTAPSAATPREIVPNGTAVQPTTGSPAGPPIPAPDPYQKQ